MTDDRCGTFAGAQTHKRKGEPMCEPCRRANRGYMREYRKREGVREWEIERAAARDRALSRLAKLHPGQYQILYDEEIGRARR